MLSKLKVFFLVVTCSLSLGLGFLLPVFSSQKTTLAVDSPVLPSPDVFPADEWVKDWTFENKQKVLKRAQTVADFFAFILFSEPPKIVATDFQGKEWTYRFDQVVSEFRTEIRAQKKWLWSFDYTKLSSLAQNQIFQFFNEDSKWNIDLFIPWTRQLQDVELNVWNTLQPLIYQVKVLNVKNYKSFWGADIPFESFISKLPNENTWNYFENKNHREMSNSPIMVELLFFLYRVSSLPFAHQTLTAALDKDWLPKLKVLQSAPGLASLRVGKEGKEEDVDVSSLTSSNSQHIAGLGKDQTDTLAKFKDTTLQDLQKLVAPHTLPKLVTFQKNVQNNQVDYFLYLPTFNIQTITVGDQTYSVDHLTTVLKTMLAQNSQLDFTTLTGVARTQLLLLLDAAGKLKPEITQDIQNQIQSALDTYKTSIQTSLTALANNKVVQIKVGGKTYLLNHLLAKDNLNKPVSKLLQDARTQLLNLVKTKITKTQLDTALNQVLTARRAQVEKEKVEKAAKAKPKKPAVKKPTEQKPVGEKTKETKKAKDKKTALTIGLATGGGVLLLAGGTGGFLYWFYKIKK